MAWVAVDRAVRTLEEWPELEGPLEQWRALRDDIFTEVCEKGYNQEVGAFTQYYGSDKLDASVLMIPLVGFLPPSDPRVVSTVEAIQRDLMDHGLRAALPHDDDGAVDGLTGREGAFLACSFWLVDCLHMIGRDGGGRRSSSSVSWPCATTSVCSRRSTTRWRVGWSATFPRPSRTCP